MYELGLLPGIFAVIGFGFSSQRGRLARKYSYTQHFLWTLWALIFFGCLVDGVQLRAHRLQKSQAEDFKSYCHRPRKSSVQSHSVLEFRGSVENRQWPLSPHFVSQLWQYPALPRTVEAFNC